MRKERVVHLIMTRISSSWLANKIMTLLKRHVKKKSKKKKMQNTAVIVTKKLMKTPKKSSRF